MHVKRLTIVTLVLALLGNSAAFGQAQARKFQELSIHPKFIGETKAVRSFVSKVRSQVNGILAGQKPLDEQFTLPDKDKAVISNRDLLNAWFGQNLIPKMTQLSNLGNLAQLRAELMIIVGRTGRNPGIHQFLVDLIYNRMSELAAGANYHPAVRYNAVLTISQLNETEAGNRAPPRPLTKGTQYLLQQYQAAKADTLRLGALVGLLRHVELDRAGPFLSPQLKQQIVQVALALLNAEKPPQGRDLAGHTWLRRRAIDILAAVGFDKPDGSILKKITSIIGDANAPLSLRLTAAQSLARFNYNGTKIDPVATAQKLGSLAVAACRAEEGRVGKRRVRDALLAQRSKALTEGFGDEAGVENAGGDAASMAAMFNESDDDGTTSPVVELLTPAERRMVYHSTLRIRSQLFAVYRGLGSEATKSGLIVAANDAPAKVKIKQISEGVVDIVRAMDGKAPLKSKEPAKPLKKEMDLDTVLKAVKTRVLALENQLPVAAQQQGLPQQTKQNKKKSDAELLKGLNGGG